LSYAPTAILLNSLPYQSDDPIDFLPVVPHLGSIIWAGRTVPTRIPSKHAVPAGVPTRLTSHDRTPRCRWLQNLPRVLLKQQTALPCLRMEADLGHAGKFGFAILPNQKDWNVCWDVTSYRMSQ